MIEEDKTNRRDILQLFYLCCEAGNLFLFKCINKKHNQRFFENVNV